MRFKQYTFLIFLLSSLTTSALRIDRAIIASNANPTYLEFWPLVAQAWNTLTSIKPTLILIADENVTVDTEIGDVIRFDPIPGISTAMQSQVIRLLAPILFEDDVCLITDIDMFPTSEAQLVRPLKTICNDNFVIYRFNAYPDQERIPMCYNAAKGSVFKDIFNINSIHDIPSKIKL